MKKVRLPLLIIFAMALALAFKSAFAQTYSTSPLDRAESKSAASIGPVAFQEIAQSAVKTNAVTNSISPGIISIEQKLASATWGDVAPGEGEITVAEFIANIERLGIPVILDDSSDLKPESPVLYLTSTAVKGLPLDDGLGVLMRCHNSEYKVTSNALHIFSVDEMVEHPDRVVYNVSPLIDNQGSDIDLEQLSALSKVIQNAIEPETWDTEGPSLTYVANGTQGLLVIVNTYDVHRQIRQLFDDLSAQSSGAAIGRQAILDAEKKKLESERQLPIGSSPLSEK